MSLQFRTRYFNTVEEIPFFGYLRKVSKDNVKLKAEFDFWYELPDDIKHFFVQPFNFHLDGEVSYYYMEHYRVKNAADQILEGELSDAGFERLLNKIKDYRKVLPQEPVLDTQVDDNARYLVLEKTKDRIKELNDSSWKKSSYAMELESKGITPESLYEELVSKFESSYVRRVTKRIILSHGDLVMSNILYEDSIGLMKLVDPKGLDFMYMDEYYDLAKLSQCIMGNYDDIVCGHYEINIGLEKVMIERPENAFRRSLFKNYLLSQSVDFKLLRVYEASLFLSMLPYHIDDHKRIAAFLLNCKKILKVC
jgi:thiamine kinase-like enzyme